MVTRIGLREFGGRRAAYHQKSLAPKIRPDTYVDLLLRAKNQKKGGVTRKVASSLTKVGKSVDPKGTKSSYRTYKKITKKWKQGN